MLTGMENTEQICRFEIRFSCGAFPGSGDNYCVVLVLVSGEQNSRACIS